MIKNPAVNSHKMSNYAIKIFSLNILFFFAKYYCKFDFYAIILIMKLYYLIIT